MSDARRTLEEIEALAAEATPGPWGIMGRTVGINPENPMTWSGLAMVTGYGPQSDANLHLIAALPDLLAIAQGQGEEMERLRRLRDEVAKMTWPAGATYCAALLDALNATMSEPHDIGKAIGTKK